MTETKPARTARRGRIFPQIQWNEEQKARREAEREAFYVTVHRVRKGYRRK